MGIISLIWEVSMAKKVLRTDTHIDVTTPILLERNEIFSLYIYIGREMGHLLLRKKLRRI